MNDIIKAIGELWKLALCIAAPVSIYLLRGPISECLLKVTKIKRGQMEIELSQEIKKQIPAPKEAEQTAKPPEIETEKAEIVPEEGVDKPVKEQLLDALLSHEDTKAKELLEEEIAKEPEKKTELEVFYNKALCHFRKDDTAVKKLLLFKTDEGYSDQRWVILTTLGWFYRTTEQYSEAFDYYGQAAAQAEQTKDRAIAIAGQAHSLTDWGKEDEALSLLTSSIKDMEGKGKALAVLYRELAYVHKKSGKKLEYALSYEKVTEYEPTDSDEIFNAAYAQRDVNLPFLSLHNYSREIGLNEKSSMGRNNYAVQLAALGCPIRSVQQYQRAIKNGNTLAAANVAYLYIAKGFAKEAEAILAEARKVDEYHGNVDRALAQLRTDSEKEKEKFESVQKWGIKYQRFSRAFAEALLLPYSDAAEFGGTWDTKEGEIVDIARQEDGSLTAEWGEKWSRMKITGFLENRSLKLKLYKKAPGAFSDEQSFGPPREALGYLSSDGQKIEIMTTGDDDPLHINLTRNEYRKAEQTIQD